MTETKKVHQFKDEMDGWMMNDDGYVICCILRFLLLGTVPTVLCFSLWYFFFFLYGGCWLCGGHAKKSPRRYLSWGAS